MIIGSGLFHNYCERFSTINLPPENRFSLFCVFSASAKFFKKIDPIETRFKGFTSFVIKETTAYHMLKPKIETIYPLVKTVHLILEGAKYEVVRFLPLKAVLKELIGEITFELGGPAPNDNNRGLPDFGDISFIVEAEEHFLDPSK